jgi:hypothetical protein
MACCGLYLRKENEPMSEEIKKEVPDTSPRSKARRKKYLV